jgi:hypothetical protein
MDREDSGMTEIWKKEIKILRIMKNSLYALIMRLT